MNPLKAELNDKQMYRFFDMLASNQEDIAVAGLNETRMHLGSVKEDSFVFDINAELDTAKLLRNFKRLYDEKTAMEQVCAIDNMQRIFRERIGINGLERLLATSYTDIEWSMFLEYDFQKEKERYYRDHFIHQFRDAYFAMILVSVPSVQNAIKQWFNDQGSLVARYIQSVLSSVENSRVPDEKILEMAYRALFIAAVFHDLGYPLNHFSRVSSQIARSLSFHHLIFKTEKSDFHQLHASLASSFLFRSVNAQEIREKYENNDHGVLSAICFLMNFYQSGAACAISSEQLCVIELAARAIYDHTNNYSDDERMTFFENPVSYLLRVCDDLQEWSRFYVTVDNNRNAMITADSYQGIYSEDGIVYKTEKEETVFYKTTKLNYKKINFVDVCTNIMVTEETDNIIVEILYDLYAQLEVASMNFTYATYRHSELDKVKKLFLHQKHLPKIQLKYDLSNNIFFLANRIIEKFQNNIEINTLIDSLQKEINLKVTQAKQEIANKNAVYNEKRFLYFGMDETSHLSLTLPDRVYLTVEQHSEYIQESRKFLQSYMGLLGLLSLLSEGNEGKLSYLFNNPS